MFLDFGYQYGGATSFFFWDWMGSEDRSKRRKLIKKLWNGRNVVFVKSPNGRLNIENPIFNNCDIKL
jgi:hypothetical protein